MPIKTPSAKPSTSTKPQLSGLVHRPLDELKPWAKNPRRHSELQLTKLAAAIRTYGFTSPVIVDEDSTILSGHARVEAARRLQIPEVPTRVLSGLTQSQKRAFVIADNKLALLSTWDAKLLVEEIEMLVQDDFEIEITGYSTAEIDQMLYPETGDPDDQLPEVDEPQVVTRNGDLWKLGVHRLLCGSALDAAAYERLMQGQRAQMTITDPPYNVKIDGHVCGNGKVKHAEFAMASGEMSSAQFTGFLGSSLTLIGRFSQDGAICFIFMDWRHSGEIQDAAHPAHLAEDYVMVSGDGAQLDRAAALTRYSHPTFATSMRSFPVDKVTVRRFHDVALIHAEKAYQLKDGRKGISRYTDIWQMRDGKWLCIAAHISVLRVPAL